MIWALLYAILAFIVGVIIGQWTSLRPGPMRRWCVFDRNDPEDNQTIVEAYTKEEAVYRAALEVFDMDVEEAQ
jgi:hypothetical protein